MTHFFTVTETRKDPDGYRILGRAERPDNLGGPFDIGVLIDETHAVLYYFDMKLAILRKRPRGPAKIDPRGAVQSVQPTDTDCGPILYVFLLTLAGSHWPEIVPLLDGDRTGPVHRSEHRVRVNRRSLTGEDAGKVHLRGLDVHDHVTFCGHCWTGEKYEDTHEPVDCLMCVRAMNEARELLLKEATTLYENFSRRGSSDE